MYMGNTIGLIGIVQVASLSYEMCFSFWNIHTNISRKYILGHCVNGERVIDRVNGGEGVIGRVR